MKRSTFLGLSIVTILVISVLAALAQPTVSARRRNWVPSGSWMPALGDLWSFKCPSNGTFTLLVDNMVDNPTGTSNLDLYFEVVDSKGTVIAVGDEEMSCSHAPVCGWNCPEVINFPCGTGLHTIAVGSFPSVSGTCSGGGAYALELSVFTKSGKQAKDKQTGLGGGRPRQVPRWAEGIGKKGPILDDQVIPTKLFLPVTITFDNLSGLPNFSPYLGSSESGFTISPTLASWQVFTLFGDPEPLVAVERPPSGSTVVGEFEITAGGSRFTFNSVGIYSSVSSVPYVLTGLLDGSTVFEVSDTLPDPAGTVPTVLSPNSADLIDTLVINLTNPSASCFTCGNWVGFDNVVLSLLAR